MPEHGRPELFGQSVTTLRGPVNLAKSAAGAPGRRRS